MAEPVVAWKEAKVVETAAREAARAPVARLVAKVQAVTPEGKVVEAMEMAAAATAAGKVMVVTEGVQAGASVVTRAVVADEEAEEQMVVEDVEAEEGKAAREEEPEAGAGVVMGVAVSFLAVRTVGVVQRQRDPPPRC